MEIQSPKGIYVVGKELGKDDRFKMYHCIAGDNKVCILKIARKTAFNGLLDREAFLLETMKAEAESLEEEYRRIKGTDQVWLNYHFFFPQVIETFISKEQGNSRINILSMAHIASDLDKLTPISYLLSRENVRVDPRSSAWILGKLLRMLVFIQSQNISVKDLSGDNILINREKHYVSLFDWTKAVLGNSPMPKEIVSVEIAKVAELITSILGGDPETGKLPEDKQLVDKRYENFIKNMADGLVDDIGQAHDKFYELIWSLWPRKFHQFTTYLTT